MHVEKIKKNKQNCYFSDQKIFSFEFQLTQVPGIDYTHIFFFLLFKRIDHYFKFPVCLVTLPGWIGNIQQWVTIPHHHIPSKNRRRLVLLSSLGAKRIRISSSRPMNCSVKPIHCCYLFVILFWKNRGWDGVVVQSEFFGFHEKFVKDETNPQFLPWKAGSHPQRCYRSTGCHWIQPQLKDYVEPIDRQRIVERVTLSSFWKRSQSRRRMTLVTTRVTRNRI